MCLVSPQELGDVIAADARLPLAAADQERIAGLVQGGFREWELFNTRFGEEHRRIRQLDPGLAGWTDIGRLLTEHGGAEPAEGYAAMRFTLSGDEVEYAPDAARVLRTGDGMHVACGDYAGSPVYGSSGQIAEPAGLNTGPVPGLLRKLAFPAGAVGPAHLRWPQGTEPPSGFPPLPWGVLVFLRQSARVDAVAGWAEQGHRLDCYRVSELGDAFPVDGEAKGLLLRGLFAASVRTKAEDCPPFVEAIARQETLLTRELRRPTDADRLDRVSHAVTPLFAAVVAGPG